jgi:hypothetical protein
MRRLGEGVSQALPGREMGTSEHCYRSANHARFQASAMRLPLLSLSVLTLVFLAICIAWQCAAQAQAKPPLPSKDEAKLLLEAASDKTNLHSRGSPAFHLRVKVKSFGSKGDSIEGTYELWWASSDRWREESTWPGRTAARIANDNRLWTERGDVNRFDTSVLLDLLDFWARVGISRGQQVRRVRRRAFDGVSLVCIEVAQYNGTVTIGTMLISVPSRDQTTCLDPASNLPLYIERESARLELSDYQELGTKHFPHRLRQMQNGKSLIEAEVESLETLDGGRGNAFEHSAGAGSRPWCSCMVGPVPLHFGGAPDFPSLVPPGPLAIPLPPDFRRFGLLIFDVDDTGHSLDVEAFKHGGQIPIKDSDKRTLLKSVFKPATCGNKPIQAEFQIEPSH